MIILGTNSIKATGFDVANSCRFNEASADSLHRATGETTGATNWTLSTWIKRSTLGSLDNGGTFLGWYTSTSKRSIFAFNDNDQLYWWSNSGSAQGDCYTTAVFRDPSAWYHVVLKIDTTQSSQSDRVKIYVNNVEQSLTFGSSYPPQNEANTGVYGSQYIGASYYNTGTDRHFGGYLAETVMIDDASLNPDQFGEFDSDSPTIWKPIDVSGLTFGSDGFYLDYEDSSALGNDAAGSNNLTVTNLTATDQSTDTCTNNFITLNPLIGTGTYTDNQVYSEGNTIVIPNSTDNYGTAFGTFGATKGKWYWEAQIVWNGTSTNANFPKQIGFMREDYAFNKSYLGQNDNQTWGVAFHDLSTDGWGLDHNGSFSAISGATTMANGGTVMLALDLDNGKFYMGYNGTFFTSGDPTSGATGTGAIATLDATDLSFTIIPAVTNATNSTYYKFNFGNPAYAISSGNTDGDGFGNFEFAVPSGYFSWCTKNLGEYG